jgi:hypothetical protein
MNTSIERLEEIELERIQTQSNPAYQDWVKNLNVSRLHIDREGILRANDMMKMWGNTIHANFKTESDDNE